MWEYSIIHDGEFDTKKNRTLFQALWKLPETDSIQSDKNTVFANSSYDDFFIDLLKSQLNLDSSDIEISDDSNNVDNIVKHYQNEICLNCSKLVIKTKSNETNIACVFRHMRNMIAHGRFNIFCDTFIGFDYFKGKYTAVIKVNYNSMAKLITYFAESAEIVDIYKKCLRKLRYHVTTSDTDSLYVNKGKRAYMLYIRHYTGRYANKKDIENFVNEFSYIDKTSCMFVLVIDSTYSTKDIRAYLADQNIAIIDKSTLKKMILGEDILKNLSKTHELFI